MNRFNCLMCRAGIAWACLSLSLTVNALPSTCYGTVSKGRLEHAVKLPAQGENFTPYSSLGVLFGRTYVHSSVASLILEAYHELLQKAPSKVFVYGETGWANGGRIRPHRTHKNGLSVDFFVPVMDAQGDSVALPTGVFKKLGYAIEFDAEAKYATYTIDFEAMAEHLYQLDLAAKKNNVKIAQVIFDPPYLPKLFATRRGAYIKAHIYFMKGKAWVRHDEHFHIDFQLPCQAMSD